MKNEPTTPTAIAAAGAACLGLVVGVLSWYFVRRFPDDLLNVGGLTAVVAVLLGGVVVAYMDSSGPARGIARWFYPIGLAGATVAALSPWMPTGVP
jgi:hypothetical protein